MQNYEQKYLKYKKKYMELQNILGGIGSIPEEKLIEVKPKYAMPEKVKFYVKLITIPNSQIVRVGSSMLKIQPYFSDIDIMNIVNKEMSEEETINYFINELKIMINNIRNSPNTFFSDFKAGGVHWTVDEILNENKSGLSLREACKVHDVIKIDIIGPYEERYIEMSTFFLLQARGKTINITQADFVKSLLGDIQHYKESKVFKAVKRVWSLASMNKDIETLKKIEEIIRSNLALLSQINADIETMVLLLEHNSNYNVAFIINALNTFKERISNILDIQFDADLLYALIDNLILLFKNNGSKTDLIETLDRLHDIILNIINKETTDYLTKINFRFPSS